MKNNDKYDKSIILQNKNNKSYFPKFDKRLSKLKKSAYVSA
jgi:hypothetical protein